MLLLLKGLILGFCIAAPIGPVGLLCIRRTLQSGFFAGVSSGMGAAFADAFYASVAAFGLTMISDSLAEFRIQIRILGGLLLLLMALKMLLSKPITGNRKVTHRGLFGNLLTSFLITMTNPATIISFIAIFAGIGLITSDRYEAAMLVSGVLLGSSSWWVLLSSFIANVRTAPLAKNIKMINTISSVMLGIFGICAIISAFR